MTWVFEYDAEADETAVKWRNYDETFDGKISRRIGGYPASERANEAINSLLQAINSVPEGLEAVSELRAGMIEYKYPDNQ